MPDLVTVGLAVPARCRLHPVPHAPRCCCLFPTHVAKVLRMFCSCLFARAEQKVFRRFWRVRKRKCATAAREDDGEGNPVCAKNRSILLCESECAFCLRTLDSCRAVPRHALSRLLPANSVQSSINCLPRPFAPSLLPAFIQLFHFQLAACDVR